MPPCLCKELQLFRSKDPIANSTSATTIHPPKSKPHERQHFHQIAGTFSKNPSTSWPSFYLRRRSYLRGCLRIVLRKQNEHVDPQSPIVPLQRRECDVPLVDVVLQNPDMHAGNRI